jgi:hypothetical protein
MVGIDYMLLHVQEPVLYVMRKQHQNSATDVTPMSDYHISDGTVYQAPDLGSVVNSRIVKHIYNFQINSLSFLIFYLVVVGYKSLARKLYHYQLPPYCP